MNIYFELLCIVHILVWTFILVAFVNKKTAEINLYYLIPFIYILHILPFHILVSLKHIIEPENTEKKIKDYENNNIIASSFYYCRDNVFKNSFFNPLSAQGIMIFGAITSAWVLNGS